AVEREVEDLAALIEELGGEASLYGVSSGGALALRAAASGLPVRHVAVYETPFVLSEEDLRERAEYTEQLTAALAEGRRGDAGERGRGGGGAVRGARPGGGGGPAGRRAGAVAARRAAGAEGGGGGVRRGRPPGGGRPGAGARAPARLKGSIPRAPSKTG